MIIKFTSEHLENLRKKLNIELGRMAPGTSKTAMLLEREELKALLRVLDNLKIELEIDI